MCEIKAFHGNNERDPLLFLSRFQKSQAHKDVSEISCGGGEWQKSFFWRLATIMLLNPPKVSHMQSVWMGTCLVWHATQWVTLLLKFENTFLRNKCVLREPVYIHQVRSWKLGQISARGNCVSPTSCELLPRTCTKDLLQTTSGTSRDLASQISARTQGTNTKQHGQKNQLLVNPEKRVFPARTNNFSSALEKILAPSRHKRCESPNLWKGQHHLELWCPGQRGLIQRKLFCEQTTEPVLWYSLPEVVADESDVQKRGCRSVSLQSLLVVKLVNLVSPFNSTFTHFVSPDAHAIYRSLETAVCLLGQLSLALGQVCRTAWQNDAENRSLLVLRLELKIKAAICYLRQHFGWVVGTQS